jgi:hypothetical protein
MSERYMVFGNDLCSKGAPYDNAEDAWASADDRNRNPQSFNYTPYTVAKLVPVPRPVPPRPTAWIDDTECHVFNGLLRWPDRTPKTVVGIDDMREAIALYDATEQWEKEHGGAQG